MNTTNTVLSQATQKSIIAMLVNFISSIPDNEQISISFSQIEKDGKSHICFDATKKSQTPTVYKTVDLNKNGSLDVKIGSYEW